MAIGVPDQAIVDLSPARGSRIQTVDTYAPPARTAPADTSIGEALSLLGNTVNGIDKQKAEDDKANAELYVSQVSNALGGKGWDANVANVTMANVHPAARAMVSQKYGYLTGGREAAGAIGSPPADVLNSPELAEKWAQGQRAEAAKRAGNSPFYSAGYIEASNAEINKRLGQFDNTRMRDWTNTQDAGNQARWNNVGTGARNYNPSLSKRPDDARALVETSERLGINPLHLAVAIGYETGGTFSTGIKGGNTGNRLGLIQFGEPEKAKYGAREGQTFREQMVAVEAYLRDRGLKPGMDLKDIYSTINAGRPGLYNRSDNGGKDNILTHVAKMTERQMSNAMAFLGINERVQTASNATATDAQPEGTATTRAPAQQGATDPAVAARNQTSKDLIAQLKNDPERLALVRKKYEESSKTDPDIDSKLRVQWNDEALAFITGKEPAPVQTATASEPAATTAHITELPFGATEMLNHWYGVDRESELGGNQRAKYVEASVEAFKTRALEMNDKRYLSAVTGRIPLSSSQQEDLRRTSETIDSRVKALASEDRAAKDEERKKGIRTGQSMIWDRLLDKKEMSTDELKQLNAYDPSLVTFYMEKRKTNAERPMTGPEKRSEGDEVSNLMNEQRKRAATGEDPHDVNYSHLRDPANAKRLEANAVELAKTGGELGQQIYHKSFEDMLVDHYKFEYGAVAIKGDVRRDKLKEHYINALEEEVKNFVETNGRTPQKWSERQKIVKDTLAHVFAAIPVNTANEGQGQNGLPGTKPKPLETPITKKRDLLFGD